MQARWLSPDTWQKPAAPPTVHRFTCVVPLTPFGFEHIAARTELLYDSSAAGITVAPSAAKIAVVV